MVSDREAGEASTFEEDWAYFEASRAELSKHYEGKFIAIKNKVVVDSDSEFSPLADRVYNKYGYIDVVMTMAEAESRVVHIPSPRIVS